MDGVFFVVLAVELDHADAQCVPLLAREELRVMLDFDVWEITKRSACAGHRPISTTWVYKGFK